ncbi:MAG: NAD(P)/FAD-dependent oxidoreductase [Candidatus Sericytochromatia bacterium]
MSLDVIITGGGFSGVFCAKLLSQAGLKTLLIDRHPESQLGARFESVMLDVDTFSKTGMERPQGDELLHLLDQFYAYSPSARIKKPIDFSSVLVNGYALLQRLLREARADNLEFFQAEVKGPLVEQDRVCGVELTSGQQIKARLLIDASGMVQVLSSQLAALGLPLSEHPRNLASEYGIAYRRMCKSETGDSELHIYFSVEGGYVWRSPNDIGVGMMSRVDPEQVRQIMDDAIQQFGWEVGDVSQEALGKIPLRYPLTNMVTHGFAAVGDAAFMVNSVRGGGISAGLKGARALADVAIVALAEQDLSQTRLWEYNLKYQREVGAQLAYQDVMRMILMNESVENMEFAFDRDIITADDIRSALGGKMLDFSPMQKLQKGLRGASNPALLLRFNHRLNWAGELHKHFKAYPDQPADYAHWEQQLHQIQEHIQL